MTAAGISPPAIIFNPDNIVREINTIKGGSIYEKEISTGYGNEMCIRDRDYLIGQIPKNFRRNSTSIILNYKV